MIVRVVVTAVAVAVVLLLQAAIILGARRLAPARPGLRRLLLAVALLGLLLAAWAVDGPVLAAVIPWPGLPVWGNLAPLAAAVALALAVGERRHLRFALAGVLVLADLWLVWPLAAAAPVPGPDRIEDGVVFQTTERSCAPAAAANLLRLAGIAAGEAEMSRLCGTTRHGTADWGIVDGLRRRAGHQRVEFRRLAFAGLDPGLLPAVVSVRLTAAVQAREPRYGERWGWLPGLRHSVVIVALAGDRVQVIDPATGRETWEVQALRDLWDGTVISLR